MKVASTVRTAPGRWPWIGYGLSLQRRPLDFLQDLLQYAPIVRIYLGQVPVYVLNDPEDIYRMLVTDGANLTKGRVFDKALIHSFWIGTASMYWQPTCDNRNVRIRGNDRLVLATSFATGPFCPGHSIGNNGSSKQFAVMA